MAQLWRAQVSGGAAVWAPANGPGTPSTPTIGTIVSGDTTLTIPYSGPVTHYRVYEIGSSAPAWISAPPSPIVFAGGLNREYNVEVSGDGSTVADSQQAGTNNPGTGGGEFTLPVEPPGIDSAEAFGSATVTASASGEVSPGSIDSVEAFGAAVFVGAGPGEIVVPSIASGEAFGAPVVSSRDGASGVASTRLVSPRYGLRANGEIIVLL